MEYKVAHVALDDINTADATFRITTPQDKPSLLPSIQAVGLLTPPVVWPGRAGLIVVSGFRRLAACRQLGIQVIPARQLARALPPIDCLRMAVIENSSQRPLNLVESGRAIRQMKRFSPRDRTLTDELARLGLPVSRKMVTKLEQLVRLGAELQAAVVDGLISLNTALEIGTLAQPDQTAVYAFFSRLRMSVSKQKEILAMARDIAGRDHHALHEVLQSDRLRKIVEDQDLDRHQKTDMIRRRIKKWRYPHLTQMESRFSEAIRALKLGAQMRIDPPAHFEGTTYTLSLRFSSRDDLETAWRKFGAALQNPAIDTIFPN